MGATKTLAWLMITVAWLPSVAADDVIDALGRDPSARSRLARLCAEEKPRIFEPHGGSPCGLSAMVYRTQKTFEGKEAYDRLTKISAELDSVEKRHDDERRSVGRPISRTHAAFQSLLRHGCLSGAAKWKGCQSAQRIVEADDELYEKAKDRLELEQLAEERRLVVGCEAYFLAHPVRSAAYGDEVNVPMRRWIRAVDAETLCRAVAPAANLGGQRGE